MKNDLLALKRSLFAFGARAIVLLGLSGCATSSVAMDARDVDAFLAAQGHRKDLRVSMPDGVSWDADVAALPSLVEAPLTAETAVRVALGSNRDLRASIAEFGVARGRLVQASLPPNPAIDLGIRAPKDTSQPMQLDLGIEYDVSELIVLPLKRGAAEADFAAERIRVAGEVLDTAYRARIGFYEVQARQDVLNLYVRAFEAFQAGYAAAVELHRAGNLPEVDLATHRAAVEQARIEVASAENALLDTREALNVMLGLSGASTQWTISGPLSLPSVERWDAEEIEKRAITSSLELAEISARMTASSRRAGLYRTEGNLPRLSGGFHGERDGLSWELGGHLSVGLPVFDRNQGRVMGATSEVFALRERYVATATAIRASVRMAQNRVDSAGRRAQHYVNTVLPARERVLSETLLQYNAMQASVFQLLEAQRKVTETAIAYVETLLDCWKARAALEQLLAGRHRVVVLGAVAAGRTLSGAGGTEGEGH